MIKHDYQCVGRCEEKWDRHHFNGCPMCGGELVPIQAAEKIIREKRMAIANPTTGTSEEYYECLVQMRTLAVCFLGLLALCTYLGWRLMHS